MLVEKYKCTHCGYVYVYMKYPTGAELNKAFDKLEDDWVCPTCGKNKTIFEKI